MDHVAIVDDVAMFAVRLTHAESIAKALLKAGADPNALDRNGASPLSWLEQNPINLYRIHRH